MRSRRRIFQGHPRAAVLWGLACFVALQLGLLAVQNRVCPELRDHEYGHRLMLLRRLCAEQPGRPLIVVLGTSRMSMGLRPELLEHFRLPSGPAPLVFNFAIPGSGPQRHLLCLTRLLGDGVRPDGVVIEAWPAFLSTDIGDHEWVWIDPTTLSWRELRLVWPFVENRQKFWREWLSARLCPWFASRNTLLAYFAEGWLPHDWRSGGMHYKDADRFGWLPAMAEIPAAVHRLVVEADRQRYEPVLRNYRVSEVAGQALRQVLRRSRQEGIPTALVLLPENPCMEAWLRPSARRQLNRYLAGLSGEHEVPILDFRHGFPDSDFADGHHMLLRGANRFTERFGRELLPVLFRRIRSNEQRSVAPEKIAAGVGRVAAMSR